MIPVISYAQAGIATSFDAIPDDWQPFVKINYAFPDKELVNKLVTEYAEEKGIIEGVDRPVD